VNQPLPHIVVVNTKKRDLIIGTLAGAILMGLLLLGFVYMSNGVTGQGLTGVIVTKTFTPQPEEQITIGKGGVSEHKIAGQCVFEVKVDSRFYTIWVDQTVYDSHKVGDSYYFLRPGSR
jgi:hypothetical protein